MALEPGQDADGVVATLQRARAYLGREAPAVARLQITPVSIAAPASP